MSTPSLGRPPAMPTMVSRLPKFGLRPKSVSPSDSAEVSSAAAAHACASAGTRLTNGFYHHPGPAGFNGTYTAPPSSMKQNGFIRVPEKEGVANRADELKRGKNVGQNRSTAPHQYSQWQQGSPAAGKGRGFGFPVTSPSPPQSGPRTLPGSKNGPHAIKHGRSGFGLTHGTKQAVNGLPGVKTWTRTSGSLRPHQSLSRIGGSRPGSGPGPGSGSGVPRLKKPQAGRSQSSDNLGSAPSVPLTQNDRFRSRSLTQVRQQASPTPTPSSPLSGRHPAVTRSYSTNRPAGRGVAASSAQAWPRGNATGSPGTSRPPEARGRGAQVQTSAPSGRSELVIPSLLPLSSLKKPLLPSLSPSSKPSGISYKMSRPTFSKQLRPLRATPATVSEGDPETNVGSTAQRKSVETPSTTASSPGLSSRGLSWWFSLRHI